MIAASRHSPARRRALLASLAGTVAVALPGVARASYQATPWKAAQTPPLDLPDLDGKRWTLASQRGRVVLVNFWATWCEPCRAEMPSLQALAERMGDKLAVVGVNYQEGEPRVRGFVERMNLHFPIVLDRDGEAAKAWTRRIFPTTVLVDPRGRAHTVVVGEIDWMGPEAAKLLAAAGAAR